MSAALLAIAASYAAETPAGLERLLAPDETDIPRSARSAHEIGQPARTTLRRLGSKYPAVMAGVFPEEGMELTHILVVSDTERSRVFYTDVLGAEIYREYGGSSIVLRFLGNWLLLVTGGEPTEDKPTVTFATPSDPDHVSHSFTIRVPDCRAAYETLRARGAEFLTPPVESDWEVRAFFRDPDGHLFEISEAKQA